MPQKILRACAAPAALAVAIVAAPAAHPAPARAASAGARPVAGDVAIARRA